MLLLFDLFFLLIHTLFRLTISGHIKMQRKSMIKITGNLNPIVYLSGLYILKLDKLKNYTKLKISILINFMLFVLYALFSISTYIYVIMSPAAYDTIGITKVMIFVGYFIFAGLYTFVVFFDKTRYFFKWKRKKTDRK